MGFLDLYRTKLNFKCNKTGNIVRRNTEARLCKHCCRAKSIRITYSERVLVALYIQHVMRMRPIVICAVPRSTIFNIIS
jgi:hypothetical protein